MENIIRLRISSDKVNNMLHNTIKRRKLNDVVHDNIMYYIMQIHNRYT